MDIMKNYETLPRNLRLGVVLLLLIVNALLTTPQDALAIPRVQIITITSSAGNDKTYTTGDTIQATVTFTGSVKVSGTPELTLKIGSADKTARYKSGSLSKNLVFEYTVAIGDEDTDGISIEADKLSGTIKDILFVLPAILTHDALPAQTNHKVKDVPVITGLAMTSDPGADETYGIGEKYQVTVTFSENVIVTLRGQKLIFLDSYVGAFTSSVVYKNGSGTKNLVFEGFPLPDNERANDTDGISVKANFFALSNYEYYIKSWIQDSDDNHAKLGHNGLPNQSGHKVDTIRPKVSSIAITSDPSNDNTYVPDNTIQATVTFDDTVTVTGTPQLTLKIGTTDRKADYTSGSGTTALVFEYDVTTADEDTDGIEIEANKLSLNGGTIKDSIGNAANRTHAALATQTGHKVADVPTITGIAITSDPGADKTYGIGELFEVTVTFSETVTVTLKGDRSVFLECSVGEFGYNIAYKRGSGTKNLVFGNSSGIPDNEAFNDTDGISVVENVFTLYSFNPTKSTITDSDGYHAYLAHDGLPDQSGHKVDTIKPTVSSLRISSTPPNNKFYKIGDTIQATVTFSETMKVTGSPQLTLKIGSEDRNANWTSGSGTKNLVFEYTVAIGDEDTNGIEIAANQLSFNGGTLTDTPGNAATLTHTALAAQASHKVDGIAPKVSSLRISSTAPHNDYYKKGNTIQATVTFDNTVNVTGTPQLTLKIGFSYKKANWTSGSGTTDLVFEYTVAAGDADADGISIDADQLSLNGGTLIAPSGNAALLTHAALEAQFHHKVDAAIPTVAPQSIAITSTPTRNHIYKKDETIQATVTFDHAVYVTGSPQLTLKIGSEDRNAGYRSGSGTTDLVFEYTVGNSDTDADGISIAANQLTLPDMTATLKVAAGYALILTHAPLTTQHYHKVDGVVPTVSSLAITSSAGADNFYTEGDIIQVRVTFTEAVKVNRTPQLTLKIGTKDETAAYASGSGTTDLVFEYTVVSTGEDTDGIEIYANQLTLPDTTATITDAADNAAALTHPALPTQVRHKVDAIKPTVNDDGVTMSSSAGSDKTYKTGEKIEATVTFSEKVTVTGTPTLAFRIGMENRTAAYMSGSGTPDLVFEYTVAEGDADTDGVSIGANQLAIQLGATIRDSVGNRATLTHAALPTQPNHKVSAIPPPHQETPRVSSLAITSSAGNDKTYRIDDIIEVTVTFTEQLTVTGIPQLTLKLDSAEQKANYTRGDGTTDLVFAHTVVVGDSDADGIEIEANKLSLNGGTIKDAANNDATLTHAALPAQLNHKVDTTPAQSNHKVDTIPPVVTRNGIATAQTEQSTTGIATAQAEQVPKGAAPTQAEQVPRGSAPTQAEPAPTQTEQVPKGAAPAEAEPVPVQAEAEPATKGPVPAQTEQPTIPSRKMDAVNATPPPDALEVNVMPPPNPDAGSHPVLSVPTVRSVSLTSTGPYGALDNIQVSVTATKSVTVTGNPTVTLVIGNTEKRASYQSGSGSSTLVFQYTVAEGDGDDPNGVSLKANALMGGTIKGAADNTLNPNHPALPDQGPYHRVDTTAPQVRSLAFTSTRPYSVGNTIQVTVTTSEPVTVTGNPTLTLVVGSAERTASYLGGTETTELVFGYTVTTADTDGTDRVSVKANVLRYNGGTMVDATGNALNLSHRGVTDGEATEVGVTGTADDPLMPPHSDVPNGEVTEAVEITGTADDPLTPPHSDATDGEDAQVVEITGAGVSTITFTSIGPYKVKDIIQITVTTAEKVTVTGTPRIPMTMGTETRYANYVSGPRTTTLVFQYTVVAGDEDTDGIEIPQNALEHYDGSAIKRDPHTDLDLRHPSVAAATTHIVKTTQPAVTPIPQGRTVPVSISEIMFATGASGNLPQWIELYNASKTDGIALQGWRLHVEVYDPLNPTSHRFTTFVIHKNLQILPNQTVLIVTKNGRNSQHFPEQRLYNLTEQHPAELEQFAPTAEFLNELGYALVLRDASDTEIDSVGNLDGDSRTNDTPSWKMYKGMSQNGVRTSIIRQYEKGTALDGTFKSNWFRAADTKRTVVTYYGHQQDRGYPGWRKGGPLPVQLSSFRAERTEQGALIQWTTASELENAGFNVLRCETKTGTFRVVTPRTLQGAGTTSERSTYQYVDTTAKAGVAYYYRLEEVSFAGVRQPVATRRLRGHVSAANRSLTTFGSLKKPDH